MRTRETAFNETQLTAICLRRLAALYEFPNVQQDILGSSLLPRMSARRQQLYILTGNGFKSSPKSSSASSPRFLAECLARSPAYSLNCCIGAPLIENTGCVLSNGTCVLLLCCSILFGHNVDPGV